MLYRKLDTMLYRKLIIMKGRKISSFYEAYRLSNYMDLVLAYPRKFSIDKVMAIS